MSLVVSLDISKLLGQAQELSNLNERLEEEISRLTQATYVHITEEATQRLNIRRQIYLDNLSAPEQIDPHLWEIKLDPKASWIEEGLKAGFDMLPGFLASPHAKSGKNGKYLVIPFKHNKAPSKQTAVQQFLSNAVKADLAKKNIPYKKIEKGPGGSAKLGLLHRTNVEVNMSKAPKTKEGKPWEPSKGSGPLLHGLSIYQKKSNTASSGAAKDILTFRTASAKHSGQKWKHPGLEPLKFFDEAAEFASNEWEKNILPSLLKEFGIE